MKIQDYDAHRVFFTADTHFGHANIISFCGRPFKSIEDMNEGLIAAWNDVVPTNGIVFHLDDLAFTQAVYTDEKTVERLMHVIHELEPSGVGARDLQECLLLQLKHKTPT